MRKKVRSCASDIWQGCTLGGTKECISTPAPDSAKIDPKVYVQFGEAISGEDKTQGDIKKLFWSNKVERNEPCKPKKCFQWTTYIPGFQINFQTILVNSSGLGAGGVLNIPVLVWQIFWDLFRFILVYSGYSRILFRIFRDFFKENCMDLGTHFLKSKVKCSKWHDWFQNGILIILISLNLI